MYLCQGTRDGREWWQRCRWAPPLPSLGDIPRTRNRVRTFRFGCTYRIIYRLIHVCILLVQHRALKLLIDLGAIPIIWQNRRICRWMIAHNNALAKWGVGSCPSTSPREIKLCGGECDFSMGKRVSGVFTSLHRVCYDISKL